MLGTSITATDAVAMACRTQMPVHVVSRNDKSELSCLDAFSCGGVNDDDEEEEEAKGCCSLCASASDVCVLSSGTACWASGRSCVGCKLPDRSETDRMDHVSYSIVNGSVIAA